MNTCIHCKEECQVIKGKPYHYTECGLDNVYIHGVNQYRCPKCGETAVEIPKVKDLHLLIGRDIVCKDGLLEGQEIRYLRKEIRLRSGEMAELLSVDAATYSRWENSKKHIGEAEDKLLRLIYVLNAENETGRLLHRGIRALNVLKRYAPSKKKKEKIELTVADWMMLNKPLFGESAC